MTVIKIRDRKWFKQHCKVVATYGGNLCDILPKYSPWKVVCALPWTYKGLGMSELIGCVLEVEHDEGDQAGVITDARYSAQGFWIPNWAIEWVKEVK